MLIFNLFDPFLKKAKLRSHSHTHPPLIPSQDSSVLDNKKIPFPFRYHSQTIRFPFFDRYLFFFSFFSQILLYFLQLFFIENYFMRG